MRSTFRTRHQRFGLGVAVFILFFLPSCQLIPLPYHLIDSGDILAVRVFEKKLKEEGLYPSLTVLSPQDSHGKTYLALCIGIEPNRDNPPCYRYEPQPPTVRLLSSTERQLFQQDLSLGHHWGMLPCATREFWNNERISPLFRVELGGNHFADKDHGDTLWFGEKPVMPLGGWDIISVEVSPDGQHAAIFSADSFIGDPTFIFSTSPFMPLPLFLFSSSSRRDTCIPTFQHYHQFFSLTNGTLSEPLRLPLAINGYPMHSCWSPDSKYVVYYGGRDYEGKLSTRQGGKYPDYVAIVPLEGP
jgi:hypothetical protein